MRNTLLRHSVSAAVVALTLAAGGAGRHVTAAQGGSETSIDFMVFTNDGKPVADLKAEEVTLRLGGRARPIKALRLVKLDGSAGAGPALPPPFATNADAGAAARTVQIRSRGRVASPRRRT